MAAGCQHRKAGRNGPAHVEERETVDHNVGFGQAVHLREAPGRVDLIAVTSGARAWDAPVVPPVWKRAQTVSLDGRAARTPSASSPCDARRLGEFHP